jgi:hypothetical protein
MVSPGFSRSNIREYWEKSNLPTGLPTVQVIICGTRCYRVPVTKSRLVRSLRNSASQNRQISVYFNNTLTEEVVI